MKFPGFPKEKQTWDFPTILNGYVHLLGGAQFKVLWYILRHTYGWQKSQDAISLSQFTKGIKKKNGEWLDKGIGLSRKEVWSSLGELEEMGFIEVILRTGKTSIFRPRLVQKIHQGSVENTSVAGVENTPTIPTITIPNKTNIQPEAVGVKEKKIVDKSELLRKLGMEPQTRGATYDWQDYAVRLWKGIGLNHSPSKSFFKLVKEACFAGKRGLLDATYAYVSDARANNPEKLFYWKFYQFLKGKDVSKNQPVL